MTRKLLIVVLCGFVQRLECSRVKFDQAFHEPLYRHDNQINNEPVYKREHFYPRDTVASTDQMLSSQGLIRAEPHYEPIIAHPAPQPAVMPADDYLPNDHIMQGEQFIRAEPILRRDSFIRREPIIRRETFLRGEPMIRSGRLYQSGPVLREGGVFRNDPNPYALMVSQCSCQEPQAQTGPHDTFFQIPQPIHPMQPIQPVQQQPIMAHRLILPKQILKPQSYQPIIAFPRIQRYVRKGFKPIAENIQISAPAGASTPVQEFNSFTNEPGPFQGNFQNQGHQQENTSESTQNNPVTVRNVPQMANPLTLAQMSSIC